MGRNSYEAYAVFMPQLPLAAKWYLYASDANYDG